MTNPENIIPPTIQTPTRRELDIALGLMAAMNSQDWLPGLILGLNDPELRDRYEAPLARLALALRPDDQLPQQVLERAATWQGDPSVARLALMAEYHAEKIQETVKTAYTQELLYCVRAATAANLDPTGENLSMDQYQDWRHLTTAIAWAHIAREMLENNEETPEIREALGHAENAVECLQWAISRVDVLRKSKHHPEPGAARRGRQIYYDRILAESGARKGQFVVIDVRSGDYEVANSRNEAARILRERQPDAFTWTERAGYPSPYRGTLRPTPA